RSSGGRQRILIADDEPSLRAIQQRMLSELSVEIETVESGVDARDAITARRFDVVITDLRMPGAMDGRDLVAWIERERPLLADHVLIVTGDMTASGIGGHAKLHTDRILTKPFSRADYLDRVKRALAQAARVSVAA